MGSWNIIQERFTQGELAPLWTGQPSLQMVRDGCQLIKNGHVLPQGPVAKRCGTNWLTTLGLLTYQGARVWAFVGPDNTDLFAVFYDDQVLVLDWQGGLVGASGGPYNQLVITSEFDGGFGEWIAVSNDDYDGLPPYDVTGNVIITDIFSFENDVVWMDIRLFYEYAYPDAYETPIQSIRASYITPVDAEEFIFQFTGLYESFHDDDDFIPLGWEFYVRLSLGTTEFGSEIGTTLITLDLKLKRIYELSVGPIPAILAGSTIYCQIEFFGRKLTNMYVTDDGHRNYLYVDNAYLLVRPENPNPPISNTTVYTGEELDDLHFVQSPLDERELICLHPDHPPQALYYSSLTSQFEFEEYEFEANPPEWSANNYPSIGTGAEGRLWLSGVPSNPETIWGSETYNWRNLEPVTVDPSPSDPLVIIGIQRSANTWLAPAKQILYGDLKREYALESEGAAITQTDVGVKVQTSFGSLRNPQKIAIGKNVVVATGGNTALRLNQYNRNDGGFISPNILLKAEHLGVKKFRRHFYTRDPNQTLWNIMEDGTILLCSFDDEYNIQAWSRFEMEDGAIILDGCVVDDTSGRNVVILVVKRVVDSSTKITIETIVNLRNVSSWTRTDSTVTVSSPVSSTVGGFEILAGKEVAVFTDGNFKGMQTVSTSGEIELTVYASYVNTLPAQVTCGIPFTFKLETFPQASISPSLGLTSKKRYSKAGIRGLMSVPPIINGQRPPDRSPQATMNIPEPPQAILDSDVVDMSYNDFGTITVEEPLPVRLVVSAIYGQLTSNQT
jgi:hypothetical protein